MTGVETKALAGVLGPKSAEIHRKSAEVGRKQKGLMPRRRKRQRRDLSNFEIRPEEFDPEFKRLSAGLHDGDSGIDAETSLDLSDPVTLPQRTHRKNRDLGTKISADPKSESLVNPDGAVLGVNSSPSDEGIKCIGRIVRKPLQFSGLQNNRRRPFRTDDPEETNIG
jgi:hypothetical protein